MSESDHWYSHPDNEFDALIQIRNLLARVLEVLLAEPDHRQPKEGEKNE